MGKRLNDTDGLLGRPLKVGDRRSVSVRKISNGYLTEECVSSSRTGSYQTQESFSKDPPGSGKAGPDEALTGAMEYLRDSK